MARAIPLQINVLGPILVYLLLSMVLYKCLQFENPSKGLSWSRLLRTKIALGKTNLLKHNKTKLARNLFTTVLWIWIGQLEKISEDSLRCFYSIYSYSCRKLDRRKDKGLKERLEVADFSNLRWKIEGVDVSDANSTISSIMQINDRWQSLHPLVSKTSIRHTGYWWFALLQK